jgi:hypothetical protein
MNPGPGIAGRLSTSIWCCGELDGWISLADLEGNDGGDSGLDA